MFEDRDQYYICDGLATDSVKEEMEKDRVIYKKTKKAYEGGRVGPTLWTSDFFARQHSFYL
jgi:hypothetical protein